jgi:tetratricopeptide (TPR) repeat protein
LSIEKAQAEAKLALAQKTGDPQSGAAQAEVARLNVLLIVTRKQLRGVELIDAGRLDEALAELVDAEKQLDKISTGSAQDRNQRGYTYKTYAQVFREKRDYAESVRYADLAQNLFQLVRDDPKTTPQELARAIHGIGNIKHLRGDYEGAIAEYRAAIAIFPRTPYGWYDLFIAYRDRAEEGKVVDVTAMREAFQQTKDNDSLSLDEVDALQRILARYEEDKK